MAKSRLKIRVRKLRKNGKSIREIVNLTGASLSTASYWCRDIKLTQKQKARLIKKQKSASYPARLKFAEKLKKERLDLINKLRKEGIRELGKLKERELFVTGIGLYWGEGYRKQEKIGFTSSDPHIIQFMIMWFKKFLEYENKDFILRTTINNSHKNRIKEVEKFWSKITGIPQSQFIKPSFIKIKSQKKYENPSKHYGTLRIVLRRSTNKHRKLMGWIEGAYQNIK